MLVVVSGCSGGGKSTLLEEMQRRGHPVVAEPGRQIVREQRRTGGDALPWVNPVKFIELCISRSLRAYENARLTDRVVFFDRSLVDPISAYASIAGELPPHYTTVLDQHRYATRVFMAPPWKALFAGDEERRHSFGDAVAEYQRLLVEYPAQGYEVVHIPKLSIPARADFLEKHLP